MTRVHGLDALRAAMMWLGIVLHAALNYMAAPVGSPWPYKDPQTNVAFDLMVGVIHLFRMPAFFVMGGFFAAYVYDRRGLSGFLRNRARRLLVPLVVAWPFVFALSGAGFEFANASAARGWRVGLAEGGAFLTNAPFDVPHLTVLWFLWHLFIFSALAALVVPFVERRDDTDRTTWLQGFARWTPGFRGCLLLGALTAVTLIPMRTPAVDTSMEFVPAVRVLVAYGVFFTFGWLLFIRQDLLPSFGRHPWRFASAGLGITLGTFVVIGALQSRAAEYANHPAITGAMGVATWLFVYAAVGIFMRHFNTPRPWQRYLADASYWIYLVHFPLILFLVGFLAPVAVSPFVKFAIVCVVTSALALVSYHYLVRGTVIGVLLNGRRASGRDRVRDGDR